MIRGLARAEGLAFIFDVDEAPHLFLPYQPSGTSGLAKGSTPMLVTSPVDGTMMLLPRPCCETVDNEHWFGVMGGKCWPSRPTGGHTVILTG